MNFLYTMLGLRLIFGTRIGCALFAIFGSAAALAILMNGKLTTTIILLLIASGFAAKRAFKRLR